jgi:hypothetical protein
MKPSRLLAIRFLVAVACGLGLAALVSTSAAADDGPDLAAIDRYVRSEMGRSASQAWRSASCREIALFTCRASGRRTGPDGT